MKCAVWECWIKRDSVRNYKTAMHKLSNLLIVNKKMMKNAKKVPDRDIMEENLKSKKNQNWVRKNQNWGRKWNFKKTLEKWIRTWTLLDKKNNAIEKNISNKLKLQ